MSGERLVSIVQAAPGWRVVLVLSPPEDADLEMLPDHELFYLEPVACFAHVADREGFERVEPVFREEGSYLDWDNGDVVGVLAPGEGLPRWVRARAVSSIGRRRARFKGSA